MLDLAADLHALLVEGKPVAVVTVAAVAHSAPRGVGASMAVTHDARVIGSISGGCVEGDAVMLALDVLRTGIARTARFGFDDDAAHAAGLACGGSVEVLCYRIDPADPVARDALTSVTAGSAVSIGIVASGSDAGRVIPAECPIHAVSEGPETACIGHSASEEIVRRRESSMLRGAYDGEDLLVVSRAPAPRLIVVGAGEHAAALCRVANAAGYAVTVIDVWPLLVTAERFPDAALRVEAIPHEYLRALDPNSIDERTAICVLSHDERVDVPALEVALRMPVGFVGAMGARRTVIRRAELLRAAGVDDEALSRLHSPLGLDLGGSSPEETAVSALAEILAVRGGGSGMPLRQRTGPLHRRPTTAGPPASPASCSPAAPLLGRTRG